MRIALNRILFTLVVIFSSVAVNAAPGGPPPPTAPLPPGFPLDGSVFLLALLSVIYGLYKLHQLNTNKKAS
jgi:hypothetical protein